MSAKKNNVENVLNDEKILEEMNDIIAVDVGYGFLKYFSSLNPKLNVIPSAVSMGKGVEVSRMHRNTNINLNELVVEIDGALSYVGERAMDVLDDMDKRTISANRSKDPMSRVLFQTAIGLSLPEESGVYKNLTLVTGLPNVDYDSAIKEELEEFLLTPFTIKFHLSATEYIEKEIHIDEVHILHQPEGTHTYYQYFMGNPSKGQAILSRKPNFKKMLGIIDIGHVTTDHCIFVDGKLTENGRTIGSTYGVSDVYDEADIKITKTLRNMGHTRIKLLESELDRAILHKQIRVAQGTQDVEEEVAEAVSDTASLLMSTIRKMWRRELELLEGIVVTGGGAVLFEEALRKEFDMHTTTTFQMMDASQYANVLGYYMYAVNKLSESQAQELIMEIYENYVLPIFGEYVLEEGEQDQEQEQGV